jgi:hypothetical protein
MAIDIFFIFYWHNEPKDSSGTQKRQKKDPMMSITGDQQTTSPDTPLGTAIHHGGCQCGAVRYEIQGALEDKHVCHCRMCQRATGGLFAAFAPVSKNPTLHLPRASPPIMPVPMLPQGDFATCVGPHCVSRSNHPDCLFDVSIGSLDDPSKAKINWTAIRRWIQDRIGPILWRCAGRSDDGRSI